MIKLVAFDWNGTIFADTAAILEGVNKALEVVHVKPISLSTFQKHFDVPVTKTYLGVGIPATVIKSKALEINKAFHLNYEKRAARVRTRAFAKKLLWWLAKNHIKSIIFSNHIDEPIRKQLKRLRVEEYFLAVLANSDIHSALKTRSKQDKLKDYIKNNKFLTDEVIILGDTVEEIEIGKELGLITIVITDGNCSTLRLKAGKPNYLINNLREVISIIKEINHSEK